VLYQVVHRMLEGAGEELPRQIDGQELGLRVDVFVAGHGLVREESALLRRAHPDVPGTRRRACLTRTRIPGAPVPSGLRRSDRRAKITQDFSYNLVSRQENGPWKLNCRYRVRGRRICGRPWRLTTQLSVNGRQTDEPSR
jgi:hypothetical protein